MIYLTIYNLKLKAECVVKCYYTRYMNMHYFDICSSWCQGQGHFVAKATIVLPPVPVSVVPPMCGSYNPINIMIIDINMSEYHH